MTITNVCCVISYVVMNAWIQETLWLYTITMPGWGDIPFLLARLSHHPDTGADKWPPPSLCQSIQLTRSMICQKFVAASQARMGSGWYQGRISSSVTIACMTLLTPTLWQPTARRGKNLILSKIFRVCLFDGFLVAFGVVFCSFGCFFLLILEGVSGSFSSCLEDRSVVINMLTGTQRTLYLSGRKCFNHLKKIFESLKRTNKEKM